LFVCGRPGDLIYLLLTTESGMRFFTRSIMGIFLAAVSFGLLALAVQVIISASAARLAGDDTAPPRAERIYSANVVTATPGTIAPILTAYGEVRSRRTLELRSAVGGTITDLAPGFEDGASVTEGALLIRLDPAEKTAARDLAVASVTEALAEQASADADLALARDDLAAARRQVELRQQALTRQQDLRSRGGGSDAAVEEAALALSSAEQAVLARRQAQLQAEARIDTAASSLMRANITLAEAERALRDTVIHAPFDGRLSDVAVVQGGLVTPNEVLARIIDPAELEVMIRLSAGQAAQLPPLGTAPTLFTVQTAAGAPAAQGILTREGATVGEGESGRLVFGSITGADGLLPGDFVTVALREPPLADVALLPGTALGADGQVLALGPDDRLEAIPVTLLRRQGDDVIVAPGAAAGREVVAERSPLLGAGIRIAPLRAGFVTLTDDRRAALIALLESADMDATEKAATLGQLTQDQVPAALVARLETTVGG
jgi:biotin carboxyl carrier protein